MILVIQRIPSNKMTGPIMGNAKYMGMEEYKDEKVWSKIEEA